MGRTNKDRVCPGAQRIRFVLAVVLMACVIGIGAAAAYAQSIRTASVYTISYEAGPDGWVDGVSPQSSSTGFSPVTAIPDAGYHFVNWSDGVTSNPRTDSPPSQNKVVTANFLEDGSTVDPGPYTLTFGHGAGGTVTGQAAQVVAKGSSSKSVTADPATGYHFYRWTGTGGFHTTSANPLIVSGVTADMAITANFTINTYTLKYTAGAGGSISGTALQTVSYGASGTKVTAVPAVGQHFVRWSDGVLTAARTDVAVDAAVDVTASFAVNTYTLKYAATAGGSITGVTSQTVAYGGSGTQVAAVPDLGQHFVAWSDGRPAPARTDTAITADIDATALFAAGADARDDAAIAFGRPVGISPLVNDDPGVGHLASFTQPANGAVSVSGSDADTLSYTPADGFVGSDTFTYTTESGATAVVSVTVEPNVSAPKDVRVAQVTTHSVNVTWSAPDSFGSGFASYVVEWRASGASDWNTGDPVTAAQVLHETIGDPALVAGTTYEFRVSAEDTGAVSATSDPIQIQLQETAVTGVIAPVATLAGSTATLTVEGVGAGAAASVGPDAGQTPGVDSVVIDGTTITVTTDPGFTGAIVLPVTVTDGGSSQVIEGRILVSPVGPTSVTFGVTSSSATRVQWAASPGATGYRVYVSGSLVGSAASTATSCAIARFLGPKGVVSVQATGADGTASALVRATYRVVTKVTAALVTFSGTSAKLSTSAKSTLKKLATLMKTQGFTSARLDAYPGTGARTTAAKKKLAAARVAAVKAYLAAQFKALHVRVSLSSLSWTSKHSSSLSTRYRRCEVSLQ